MAEFDVADLLPEFEGEVEITEDGGALIGEVEIEEEESGLREHDDNLVSMVNEEDLAELASKLHSDFDSDVGARDEWMSIYSDGMASMVGKDIDDEDSDDRSSRRLTDVNHPLISEAATQFQARAIVELFPSQGPVGTTVVGKSSIVLQEQALRVGTYMNYQLTEEMPEYFPDLDQMLFHLPLVGHTFKKSWFDVNLNRVTSRFVRAEDFVCDPDATDLDTAQRYSHVLRIQRTDYDTYVENDFYLPTESTGRSLPDREEKELEGTESSSVSDTDTAIDLIEAHVYLNIEDDRTKPYVVTYNAENDEIVAIRRNWDIDDKNFKKQVWFTSYKFLPGLGFWGFGLYHVIGGLGKAATGALRALLDAATYANMQGGFKLRGRVKGGDIEIKPGEFVDIDAAVDDVTKAIMPLPFKEPSQTMMQLLQFVVETGKRFANTADMNIADANQNTPVGTTMALLEENTRVFSAIHKRLHNSQKNEFRVIAKLNGIYLPAHYPFSMGGEENYVLSKDFDKRVDVIPVSDPSTFSSTQRIAQAQAMMQLAQTAPHLHNEYNAYRRMYEALRIPNFEEVLRDPTDVPRMDAVAENVALMHGQPLQTFEDQDHMAHMAVLDDWFKRLDPQVQPMYAGPYAAHRAEHTALYYRAQIQAQLGAPMPALMNFRDPSADAPEIDSETDAKISQAAATVVNSGQQGPLGPPMQPPAEQGGAAAAANDPLAAAKMLAEAEAMSIQAKTQATIQANQAKAQSDMQLQKAKMQLDMQMKMIEMQAKSQEALMREKGKAETDQAKLNADIKAMWMKAQADIKIAREKSQAEIQLELHAHNALEHRNERQLEFSLIDGGRSDG
tara:strand:+ start:2239 stop:4764 length:2526 start_codon:yes stop_codon:yes gene_type:complete